ncbi:MAG: caspase family protein, partial [Mycoplasmataceae bacterium]|nr:caspase family protein [Mycoplasmataceae bacterium]
MAKLKNAYALLIGVGDEKLGTAQDAKDIYDILIDENFAGYDPKNVILVKGKESTRKHILDAFDELHKRTDENSSVFLYYSGHGGKQLGKYFIQPYGMHNNMDEKEFTDAWVPADELKEKLGGLKSKRLIFFLDCCHAAGMTKGIFDVKKSDIKSKSAAVLSKSSDTADGLGQMIDNERGVSIISSCREEEESFQWGHDRNSLFTKYLIKAFNGEHKTHFEKPFIRLMEISEYLQEEVPLEAKEQGKVQRPYVNLQMYDNFIMSYVPKAIREKQELNSKVEEELTVSNKKMKEVVTSFRETKNANNLLLFIHGFSGEAEESFGIIPELLMNNKKMDGWDIKPLGYSQHVQPELGKDVWAGTSDINKISEYLTTCFDYKFEKYKRIAIVAHGLGGIVAQQTILNLKDEFLNKLSHVILLASPNNGIAPSVLSHLWNNKYQELSSVGEFMLGLRSNWKSKFENNLPFQLKIGSAIDDEHVAVESNFGLFDKENCVKVGGNHLSMIKPEDENNDCYQLIINTLTDNEFHNQFTNNEEINIALGNYDAVIKELLPKTKDLDLNGLRQLTFALESSDRSKEALETLLNHTLTKNDSDILGIIGGRFKRSYLKNNLISDGEKSLEYYKRALVRATEAQNNSQIYYHAINLAFLSAVINNNETAMIDYANMALEAAQKCRNNLWKTATIAEANLYLDNM